MHKGTKKMKHIKIKYFYEVDGKLLPAISFKQACDALKRGRRSLHKYVQEGDSPEVLKEEDGVMTFFDLTEFETWRANRKD
jgi:hypothetical protein